MRDLRLAARRLRRTPGFTLVAVLTLALGVGANAAVFSVLDRLIVRRLPVAEPDRLVVLRAAGTVDSTDLWWPDALDRFRQADRVLAGAVGVAATRDRTVSARGMNDTVSADEVSAGYFEVLGLAPHAGRLFAPGDAGAAAPAVVLGYDYWVRRLGADRAVVGKTMDIDGVGHVVAGVAPRGFRGVTVGLTPDMYIAIGPQTAPRWMRVFARLRPGVSIERAREALDGPFRAAVAASGIPAVERPQALDRLIVEPAARGVSGLRERYGRAVWLLMGIVALVLLTACANVASLVLARAADRRHELAIARALGASRARLARQMLVEHLVVIAAGGALGLAIAAWTSRALVLGLTFGDPRVSLDTSIDARVLVFTAIALGVTIVASGVLPALAASRGDTFQGLGSRKAIGGAGARDVTAGAAARWPRGGLVVAQVALSVVLLGGAGLLVHSLVRLTTHDVGFDPDRVLVVSLADRASARPGAQLGDDLLELMARVSRVPGVEAVAQAAVTPFDGREIGINVRVADAGDARTSHAFFTSVSPGYFATLNLPLTAGRDFTDGDVSDGAGPTAILNQTLSRRLFGAATPIGRSIRFVEGNRPPMRVIGVAADSTYTDIREAPRGFLYLATRLAGARMPRATLLARAAPGRVGDATAGIERVVAEAGPDVAVTGVQALRSAIGDTLHGDRLIAALSSAFGGLALAITAIGLFGVSAGAVARRGPEIGLRVALGAERRHIAGLVFAPVLGLVGAGLAVGLAGAALAGPLLSSLLFGVEPFDPVSLGGVSVVLIASAALACLAPLRRALRVDPAVALRSL